MKKRVAFSILLLLFVSILSLVAIPAPQTGKSAADQYADEFILVEAARQSTLNQLSKGADTDKDLEITHRGLSDEFKRITGTLKQLSEGKVGTDAEVEAFLLDAHRILRSLEGKKRQEMK